MCSLHCLDFHILKGLSPPFQTPSPFCMRSDPVTPVAFLLVFWLQACSPVVPAEEISVPALFSDHMVLQQNKEVAIWGSGSPGGRITVEIAGLQKEVIVPSDSNWAVRLDPVIAGGPYTLQIAGADTLRFEDVYFGEVWLASGQSNMEWSVRASDHATEEIAAANHPMIRLFTVERTTRATPSNHVPSTGWEVTTPETIDSFSAVAYYFGRKLQQELGVPIGLIHSSWGGSPAEAWTRKDALGSFERFEERLQLLEQNPAALLGEGGDYTTLAESWLEQINLHDAGYRDENPVWADPSLDDADWETFQAPSPWEPQGHAGYDGIGWYRTTISLTESPTRARLMVPAIDDADITWVNGVEVGRTEGYNLDRAYTVPPEILQQGTNVIAIRVTDTGGDGGLRGAPEDYYIETDNQDISLAGPWKFKRGNEPGSAPRPLPVHHVPTALYNGMIAPLVPYTLQGTIWYQGESNASQAYEYRSLFRTMIQDWRSLWQDEFTFLFVQLANFRELQKNPVEVHNWPELREAQNKALDLPKTGMAVTIDIGEADDIHPRNKQEVGRRLALAGLRVSYGKDLIYSGPIMQEVKPDGQALMVYFEHTGSGLTTSDGEATSRICYCWIGSTVLLGHH